MKVMREHVDAAVARQSREQAARASCVRAHRGSLRFRPFTRGMDSVDMCQGVKRSGSTS